jgi:Rap1a immunity proteins
MSSRHLFFVALLMTTAIAAPCTRGAETKEYPWTSGNAFLRLCGGEMPPADQSQAVADYSDCLTYVHGVVDGISAFGFFLEHRDQRKSAGEICIPEGVDNQQLLRVVAARMRSKPESLQYPSSWLIHTALVQSFGCKTGG